jgi:hypothetical protein
MSWGLLSQSAGDAKNPNLSILDESLNQIQAQEYSKEYKDNTLITPQAPKTAPNPAQSFLGDVKEFGTSMINQIKQGFGYVSDLVSTGIESADIINKANKQDAATKQFGDELTQASKISDQKKRQEYLQSLGTPNKYITAGDMQTISDNYKKLEITPDESIFNMARTQSGKVLNAAFALTTVGDIGVSATGIGAKMVGAAANKIAQNALANVSNDAIKTALVKSVLSDTVKTYGNKTLSEIGDKILQDGGESAEGTLRALTDQGKTVLSKSLYKRIGSELLKSGSTNAAIAAFNSWSAGNNFKTPEERKKALDETGVGFLTGAGLASIGASFEVAGSLFGKSDINAAKANIAQLVTKDEKSGWEKTLSDTGTKLTLNSKLSSEQASYIQKLSSAYLDYVKETRSSEAEELFNKQKEEIKRANLEKGRQANALRNNKNWYNILTNKLKNMKSYQSLNDAAANMQDEYGVSIRVVKPEDNIPSGVTKTKDGYISTIQDGSYDEYYNNAGNIVYDLAKKDGLNPSFYKDELEKAGKSNLVKEIDDPKKVFSIIVQNLNGKDAAFARANFPKISAIFSAYHGIISQITTDQANNAYLKENLSGSLFKELNDLLTIHANTVDKGKNVVVDPQQVNSIKSGIIDLIKNGNKELAETTIKKMINVSNEILNIKDKLNSLIGEGKVDEGNKILIEKSNTAFATVKSLDAKLTLWKNLAQNLGVDVGEFKGRVNNNDSVIGSPVNPAYDTTMTGETNKTTSENVNIDKEKSSNQGKPTVKPTANNFTKPAEDLAEDIKKNNDNSLPPEVPGQEMVDKENQALEMKKAAQFVIDDKKSAISFALGGDVNITPYDFNNDMSAREYVTNALMIDAAKNNDKGTLSILVSANDSFGGFGTKEAQTLAARKARTDYSLTDVLKTAQESKSSTAYGDTPSEKENFINKVDKETKDIADTIKTANDNIISKSIKKLTC